MMRAIGSRKRARYLELRKCCDKRASPCGFACMCLGACAYLRAACIAAAVVERAAQRSRRGAQGYHYGSSRHSLLIAGFQHESQTNERTLARSFARSPSLCFPRRARTHNTDKERERKKENGYCISVYMLVHVRVQACAPRWRYERMHTGVETLTRPARRVVCITFFYVRKYTSPPTPWYIVVDTLEKGPLDLDEKRNGERDRKMKGSQNGVCPIAVWISWSEMRCFFKKSEVMYCCVKIDSYATIKLKKLI